MARPVRRTKRFKLHCFSGWNDAAHCPPSRPFGLPPHSFLHNSRASGRDVLRRTLMTCHSGGCCVPQAAEQLLSVLGYPGYQAFGSQNHARDVCSDNETPMLGMYPRWRRGSRTLVLTPVPHRRYSLVYTPVSALSAHLSKQLYACFPVRYGREYFTEIVPRELLCRRSVGWTVVKSRH